MTDLPQYADYVRIEIHKGGKAEIVELRPDEHGKVKAELVREEPVLHDVSLGGMIRSMGSSRVDLTLKVSGPSATRIRRDLEGLS